MLTKSHFIQQPNNISKGLFKKQQELHQYNSLKSKSECEEGSVNFKQGPIDFNIKDILTASEWLRKLI